MARPSLKPGEWGEINAKGVTSSGKIRARARYCTPSGKVISVEAAATSKPKAIARLKARIAEWEPEKRSNLFRDVSALWLEDLRTHNEVRRQSADNYARVLKTTLLPKIGGRTVGGIGAPDIQRVLDEIRQEKPGQYSPAITVCRGVFGYAMVRGIIEVNPTTSIKRRKVETKDVRALELHELAGLRGMVREWQAEPRRTQPLLDIVDLALSTGARIGELLALTWDDVDLEAKKLILDGTQVWQSGKGMIHQESTKESTRLELPLTNFGLEMLKDRRNQFPNSRYVFESRAGSMISLANLNRAWRAARGEEFSWVTWHTFRKSVATLAATATDSKTAAKLLGHTSDATTRKHYIATGTTAVPDLTAVLEALAGERIPHFDDED